MRTASSRRICWATIPSSSRLHPKHQRLISTSPPNAQQRSTSRTFTDPFVNEDGKVTAGPSGSPNYIPRKRGYAPNIPVPARKFPLPEIKHPKGIPDPQKQAPERHPREIKTVGIEYERQLNAMRRGYVQWRYENRKQKLAEKHEKMARPHPPPPGPFKPKFAEEMAQPSSNLLALEKQLFAHIRNPQAHRVKGERYHLPRHQAILERQRRTLINEFLALYHTSYNFITTPESLEEEILNKFGDFRGQVAIYPQGYASILRDAESGAVGNVRDGYISLMNRDRENEIHNAMVGTVVDGRPGYDEVVREIDLAFQSEDKKAEELAENSKGALEIPVTAGEIAVANAQSTSGEAIQGLDVEHVWSNEGIKKRREPNQEHASWVSLDDTAEGKLPPMVVALEVDERANANKVSAIPADSADPQASALRQFEPHRDITQTRSADDFEELEKLREQYYHLFSSLITDIVMDSSMSRRLHGQ